MPTVTSAPDFKYKGMGCGLAVHLTERILVINGQEFPFSEIKSVSTFVKNGFFLKRQGIEIEVLDLANPLRRVAMNQEPQKVWMSRIGQICGMTSI